MPRAYMRAGVSSRSRALGCRTPSSIYFQPMKQTRTDALLLLSLHSADHPGTLSSTRDGQSHVYLIGHSATKETVTPTGGRDQSFKIR